MKIEFVKDDKLQEIFFRYLKGHRLPADLLTIGAGSESGRLAIPAGAESAVSDRLTSLLREKMPFIAESIPDGVTVACIGVGDGETGLIIARELAGRRNCEFCAMDVSGRLLDAALAKLGTVAMKTTAYIGFLDDLPKLRERVSSPLVICCLNNSFCRREPEHFLSLIRGSLHSQDLFLFDCHLFDSGDQSESEPAVKNETGLRDVSGFGLEPDSYAFREDILPTVTPAGQACRTKSVLQIQKDCQLSVDAGTLQLKKGEEIELGFTYKYKLSQVVTLLKRLRFQIIRLFLSDDNNDLIVLVKPREDGFLKFSMLER